MSAPIDVVHPAPLRFVRQGFRKPEDDCAQVRTTVALESADPATFRPLGVSVGGDWNSRDLHEHEGRVWTRLAFETRARLLRSVSPSEFRSWLSDPGEASELASGITGTLGGTPLAQVRIETSTLGRYQELSGWRTTVGRGEPEGGFPIRTLIHDGTDLARRNLRDFLAERVRIVGKDVFVQVMPFARYVPLEVPRLDLEVDTRIRVAFPDVIARPDRAAALFEDWDGDAAPFEEEVRRMSAALPSGLYDEALLGSIANLLPRFAVALFDGSAGLRGVDRGVRAALRERVEELRSDALLAEIGGIADWEPAVLRATGLLGAIAETYPEGPEVRTARRLHAHVRKRVMPLFDAPLEQAEVEAIYAASAITP